MQIRVRERFAELRTICKTENFHVVDAGRSLEVVERDMLEAALAQIAKIASEQPQPQLQRVQPAP